ncbi:hypothetical protein KXV58_000774 [Aspergillus fumigatus]|nr:hypothetical protein CNMCM8057_001440 [Aspergillus fumigatus]KAF4289072.1 hypothetical protein CNMCM8686_003156 [Aspergillus fumigatus]KAH1323427.1 hypothetical protein KXX38_007481 [Aspergillus fumigatus]KAH1435863.1 hypothetical protein KXX32_007687 [Aspergillus fumigatus]KAH1668803.1 hypothetical protein KXX65_008579 [Aspergillus fumigatus]
MRRSPSDGKGTEESHKGQALYLTPDGQRAFLWCYYLCSKASIFRRQLTMEHTGWVDYCAASFGQRAEYPSDQSLRALIEIQSLARQSELEFDDPIHAGPCVWSSTQFLPLFSDMFFADKERFIDSIEKDRLLTIARSAFNIVTVFLASPALVTPNLPMFIYTTIWYGLLVLSKLSLLSDTATESKVVYNKDVSNLGLAAMQKMETMSRGDNVWDNCCAVIGSMISWLESSRGQPQSMQAPGNTKDAGDAHMLPQPTPEDAPRPTESAAVAEDWDATVRQQMLQDLTWIGLPVEQQL